MAPQIPAGNQHRPRVPSGLRNEASADSPLGHAQPSPQVPSQTVRPDQNAPIAMPAFGRGIPAPEIWTEFPPLRPHSPTGAYVPGPNADPAIDARHRGMANHKYAEFFDHPDAAMEPTGGLKLGYAYADALMGFRAQVRSMPDQTQMYAQTYRIGNGEFVPVHPQPVMGAFGEVALPSGSYPPGTGLVILSHPPDRANPGRAGRPEPQELLRAYQDRSNALHGPGSNVGMHMLYDAGTDMAYAYDGRLGADGKPKFFRAIVPPVPQVRTEAILPEAFAPAPVQAPAIGRAAPAEQNLYIPAHEILPASPEIEYLMPHETGSRPSQPASPSPRSVPASPLASPLASPKWDEWMDFGSEP